MKRLPIERTEHDFRFTRRWFLNRNLNTFSKYVYPAWQGRPIMYLEIGVFEGMSMVWMMQHVLTHPDSRAVGVDPWLESGKFDEDGMEQVMLRARHNLEPWKGCCKLARAISKDFLGDAVGRRSRRRERYGIRPGGVDLCMIDGDHRSDAVFMDACLCLQLVRPGGWLMFDDIENKTKKPHHVKEGLRMFLDRHGDDVREVWKHRYMGCYERIVK